MLWRLVEYLYGVCKRSRSDIVIAHARSGADRGDCGDRGTTAHHFRVLQCPMNLFESGALLSPNTGLAKRRRCWNLHKPNGWPSLSTDR